VGIYLKLPQIYILTWFRIFRFYWCERKVYWLSKGTITWKANSSLTTRTLGEVLGQNWQLTLFAKQYN